MAKKFGKFLLFTAAVGTAAAAAYYYMQKKDSAMAESDDLDDDYDDFCEDLEEDIESSRNYVALNRDFVSVADFSTEPDSVNDEFTPLAEQFATDSEDLSMEESCEEFFDEDEDSEEEPPIQDN